MSVLTFPSVLTVSETTVAVIDDAFGRQGNTCLSGNSVVTFDARKGTVAKLAMRQPFVLFKGLTFQKL
ncbi:hypothetical protein, partial [Klebsiella pneumoniae]